MKPSMLWPRCPTVTGSAAVALQIGRYRSTSAWRRSPAGIASTQPWPGRHSMSADAAPDGTGRNVPVSSRSNAAVTAARDTVSATRAAARTSAQALISPASCTSSIEDCSCDILAADYSGSA